MRKKARCFVRSYHGPILKEDSGDEPGWRSSWGGEDRYPPLPRHRGLDIFGPLTSLHFEGARGSLLVGDRAIALAAPSTVRLTNLRGLITETDGAIPVPLATVGSAAQVAFEASGSAAVNGVDETTFIQ